MKRKSGFYATLWFVTLAVLFLTVWYVNLSERQKQFVRNLLRQVPDLPARYMV